MLVEYSKGKEERDGLAVSRSRSLHVASELENELVCKVKEEESTLPFPHSRASFPPLSRSVPPLLRSVPHSVRGRAARSHPWPFGATTFRIFHDTRWRPRAETAAENEVHILGPRKWDFLAPAERNFAAKKSAGKESAEGRVGISAVGREKWPGESRGVIFDLDLIGLESR